MQVHLIAVLLTVVSTRPFSAAQETELNHLISNNPDDIKYYLCGITYNTQEDGESQCDTMGFNDTSSLRDNGFNESIPSIILIHGFSANHRSPFAKESTKAYLSIEKPYNIIVVDWETLAKPNVVSMSRPFFYTHAFRNVPIAGKAIADFINFIWISSGNGSYCPKNFHLVGFDLGAHVAGVAGYHITVRGSSALARITGLDPTSVFYQAQLILSVDNKYYLDSSDATFVDIIHTGQGIDGIIGTLGHADFYPNGGFILQPGCISSPMSSQIVGTCSHNRAWQYFATSIKNTSITACRCTSYLDIVCREKCVQRSTFGHFCPTTARGQYFFQITPLSPL